MSKGIVDSLIKEIFPGKCWNKIVIEMDVFDRKWRWIAFVLCLGNWQYLILALNILIHS